MSFSKADEAELSAHLGQGVRFLPMVSESTGADVKASRTLRVIASASAAREGQHTGPMDIPDFFDDALHPLEEESRFHLLSAS
jgi:hypothetical protein